MEILLLGRMSRRCDVSHQLDAVSSWLSLWHSNTSGMTLAGLEFFIGSQIELVTVEEKKIAESSKGPFYIMWGGCTASTDVCIVDTRSLSHSVGSQYDVRFYSGMKSKYCCAECQIVAAGCDVVDYWKNAAKENWVSRKADLAKALNGRLFIRCDDD